MRRISGSILIIFAAILGTPGDAQESPSAIEAFEAWLKEYRKGEITLGMHPGSRGYGRRGHREGAQDFRMDKAFEKLENVASVEAANLLLEAASVRLHKNEEQELVDDGRYRPWAVRLRAINALARQAKNQEILEHLVSVVTGTRHNLIERQAGVEALGQCGDTQAVEALGEVLLDRYEDLGIASANSLARIKHPRSLEALRKGIHHRKERIQVASARSLSNLIVSLGKTIPQTLARDLTEDIYTLFNDKSWQVRVEAAEMLTYLRRKASIPVLIEALTKEGSSKGRERVRSEIHDALRALTGAYFPIDEPERWESFWEQEKEHFELPAVPEKKDGEFKTEAGFFNIAVQSDRVIFVLDHSGSMREIMGTASTGDNRRQPKWDRAVAELEKTFRGLESHVKFNVILFADDVMVWAKSMKAATDTAKKACIAWLRQNDPNGATNLFGGLSRALRIQRFGFPVTMKKLDIDTVFLLSDGLPTAGELIATTDILEAVRRTNSVAKVRINTISFGQKSPFMKTLADENDGKHVHLGSPGRGRGRR